jgi:ABC-type multidrug transport system ATPase subunit
MSLLVAKAVTHAYRRGFSRRHPSLVDVDLVVRPGECWGLLGPNGSGKSTLLRILAGVSTPLAGTVSILDRPAGSRDARSAVGWVPEAIGWPRSLTVNDALTELASLSSARQIVGRVDRVASLLGLAPLLGRRLGSLSYGQSRRVVLAQALLDDPPLLLFDEAFSGLDSLVLHRLKEDLGLRLVGGAGIVLATHRVEDLMQLATHAMVLREGRVVAAGPADEVLADADHPAGLAALLGSSP